MIDTLELAGCRVYLLEFAVGDRCSGQREGEKRAVREIVESVFGDNAVLSHRPDGSPVVEGCNVEISVSPVAESRRLLSIPIRSASASTSRSFATP